MKNEEALDGLLVRCQKGERCPHSKECLATKDSCFKNVRNAFEDIEDIKEHIQNDEKLRTSTLGLWILDKLERGDTH